MITAPKLSDFAQKHGLKMEQIAANSGLSYNRLTRRLRHSLDFTVTDVRKLRSALLELQSDLAELLSHDD